MPRPSPKQDSLPAPEVEEHVLSESIARKYAIDGSDAIPEMEFASLPSFAESHVSPSQDLVSAIEAEGQAVSESIARRVALDGLDAISEMEFAGLQLLVESHAAFSLEAYSICPSLLPLRKLFTEDVHVALTRAPEVNAALDIFCTALPTSLQIRPIVLLSQRKQALAQVSDETISKQSEGVHPSTENTTVALLPYIEAGFERLQQSFDYLGLELARLGLLPYGNDQPVDHNSPSYSKRLMEWQEKLSMTQELFTSVMSACRLSPQEARRHYWQRLKTRVDLQYNQSREELSPWDRRLQLYHDHDGFRSHAREQHIADVLYKGNAYLELLTTFVCKTAPTHPLLTEVYGFGSLELMHDPSGKVMVAINMESIARELTESLNSLRKEVLRFRNAFLERPFPPRIAARSAYVDFAKTRSVDSVQVCLYRTLSSKMAERLVEITNACLKHDIYDKALYHGGFTKEITMQALESLCDSSEPRLVTFEVHGRIEGFELVFLGPHAFPAIDYDRYFQKHHFHLKKSAFFKLAGFTKEAFKECIQEGITETPFDILYRRLLSELRAEGVRHLLATIRTAPIANAASLNAVLRNYGLHSKNMIVDGDLELEVILIPTQLSGFFDSHFNYPTYEHE